MNIPTNGNALRLRVAELITYLDIYREVSYNRVRWAAAIVHDEEHEEMILRRFTLLGLRKFGLVLLISAFAFAFACGNADTEDEDSSGGGAPAAAVEEVASGPPGVEIVSTDAVFTEDDLINTPNFKKSKNYKIQGEEEGETLDEATAAIYGFFGPDPYDRQEFEARFYPDHKTAITVGVDFANEATGPDAVIAKDIQRWDEGLVQRRACSGNTRGSHHSGKCDNAKYGDYVVAGNLVLLCQGKDSETSLDNCDALIEALQSQ